MSDYDYGPLQSYEITWRDRPPEIVQAHQVLMDSSAAAILGRPVAVPMVRIHGMFPGRHWRLVLMAPESDILAIRNVTEQIAALQAMVDEDAQ